TELAAQAGRTAEVARLRRRKAEFDRATDAYRTLLDDHVPTGNYDELGRLAETLGRWFEARGWWTLVGRDPARADEARAALARLDRAEKNLAAAEDLGRPPSAVPPSRTVADALTDLI